MPAAVVDEYLAVAHTPRLWQPTGRHGARVLTVTGVMGSVLAELDHDYERQLVAVVERRPDGTVRQSVGPRSGFFDGMTWLLVGSIYDQGSPRPRDGQRIVPLETVDGDPADVGGVAVTVHAQSRISPVICLRPGSTRHISAIKWAIIPDTPCSCAAQQQTPSLVEYTAPEVLTTGVAEGWADTETDPTRINWPDRQKAALIPFLVIDGRPVSPGPASPVRWGRNGLGRWGENAMADAIVTATYLGQPYLLMVERGDHRGWALPGGAIDPGETPLDASARELAEETGGLTVPTAGWTQGEPVYVPDPRGSDEAWAVTVANRADLGPVDRLPAVTGSDDADRAEWVPANDYGTLTAALDALYGGGVFRAHLDLLRAALDPEPGERG